MTVDLKRGLYVGKIFILRKKFNRRGSHQEIYRKIYAFNRKATNSLMTMMEADKRQEKRRGITPRLTLNLAPLPEFPYENYGNKTFFLLNKTISK